MTKDSETIDEMVRLYCEQDLTPPVIAEELGVSRPTVIKYLRRRGVYKKAESWRE